MCVFLRVEEEERGIHNTIFHRVFVEVVPFQHEPRGGVVAQGACYLFHHALDVGHYVAWFKPYRLAIFLLACLRLSHALYAR